MSQSTARKARRATAGGRATVRKNGTPRKPQSQGTFRLLRAVVQLHGIYADADGNIRARPHCSPSRSRRRNSRTSTSANRWHWYGRKDHPDAIGASGTPAP